LSGQLFPAWERNLFGLAPGGVCLAVPLTRNTVSFYLAFAPVPRRIEAVLFLWHFPPARAASPLATALPCGVRTFLIPRERDATVWPALVYYE